MFSLSEVLSQNTWVSCNHIGNCCWATRFLTSSLFFCLLGSSHSPLAAYESGPLLVVFSLDQSNTQQLSCDTWFLWKPEAINATPFLRLQKIQPEATCKFQKSPEKKEKMLIFFSLCMYTR